MSHLLDVNFLLACGWASHPRHSAARAWMERQVEFTFTRVTELGFMRVSMSPGYRAAFADALSALQNITSRPGARRISADLDLAHLPALTSYADMTDAYLVELARQSGLKVATLDEALCEKPWAANVAENPL